MTNPSGVRPRSTRTSALLGRPRDWVPDLGVPVEASHLLGPVTVVATFAASAIPFVNADGDGLGLYVGTASILAMAWAFLLSIRLGWSEWAFGGLDRVYVAHRWLGIVAVVLMWWHVQSKNELESGGVAGASENLAETGNDLAGLAEPFLYVLVLASILRALPWRIWRFTHKLLIVPFAFASFHMITAEKPFANMSAWGLWFFVVIAAGVAAYLARVVWRDMAVRGRAHRVTAVIPHVRSVEVRLSPLRRPLRRRAGQFAFVKLRAPGMSEPHPFSIASAPNDPELTFMIRELGDWTSSVAANTRVGDQAIVEGPYGRLRLLPRRGRPVVWVAGGVGITPFLSALAHPPPAGMHPPTLLYAVRSATEAHAREAIDAAAAQGRVIVHYFESRNGTPLTPTALDDTSAGAFAGAHVVICGPTPLVRWVRRYARSHRAHHIEAELFDLRGGIGPDPSAALMPRPGYRS